MAGEHSLHRAVIQVATTLETVRAICDRTHEENLLAEREGRAAECHYAYALGSIWQLVTQELERLRLVGVSRLGDSAETNERALASLQAFQRSLQKTFGASS
jgi:hypothetical protein